MDEFELEVTPLGKRSPLVDDPQDAASRSASDTNQTSISVAARPVGGVSPHRHDRMLRASAVAAVVSLTIVALLLVPSGTRSAVLQLLAVPTATPTEVLVPDGDLFLWEHTVPWGTLLIDGRQGPDIRSPSVSFDQQSAQGLRVGGFHLPRGKHTLDYRAALFPTLHCTVSVPRSITDTCPLDFQNTGFFILERPGIRVLDMQATADRLQADQARALATITQSLLDAAANAAGQDTIARGDHFLAADGHSTLVADTALTAQARFTLSSSAIVDPAHVIVHCALLCSSNDLYAESGQEMWTIYAPVELSWRYLRLDGRVVLDNGPAVTPESRGSVAVAVAARREQNQWIMQLVPIGQHLRDPVVCAVGGHALDDLRSFPAETDLSRPFQRDYDASTPGPGCLLAGSGTNGTAALVLYRYGVLLAVNPEAQRIFPHLPLASAHEQALSRAAVLSEGAVYS